MKNDSLAPPPRRYLSVASSEDYAQAERLEAQLRSLGFDAVRHFSMESPLILVGVPEAQADAALAALSPKTPEA